MNNKSKELSMNSTNFVNPDGLDEVNHVTTANDLLKLSIYILENTKLLDITSKEDILLDKLDKKLYKNTKFFYKKIQKLTTKITRPTCDNFVVIFL